MVDIKLNAPIQGHGEAVQTITLREPTVEDLTAMDRVEGQIAKSIALVAKLTDLPPSSLKTIPAREWLSKIEPALKDFLSDSLETTGT